MGEGGSMAIRAARHAPLPRRHLESRRANDSTSPQAGSVTQPPLHAESSAEQVSLLQRTAGNAAIAGWLAPARGPARRRRPKGRIAQRDEDSENSVDSVAQGEAVLQRGDNDDETSPEEQFLNDLDSGAAKAKEYLEYIPSALEYWKKYGGPMPDGLKAAADNLEKISTSVSAGVDRFSGIVGKAKQALKIKRWAEGVYDVAQAARALDITDKASRDALIGSIDHLGGLTEPFIDAASDWLKGLAIEGGLAASRAFIVLQGVTAYAKLGWSALKAGLKNVEAYTDRFGYEGTEMRKIEEAERGVHRPAEPTFPGNWQTAAEAEAEKRAARRQMERDARAIKRRERLAPFVAKVEQAKLRIGQARQLFEEKGFAKRYRRRRGKLVYQVAREMRYGKRVLVLKGPSSQEGARIPRGVGSRWYDQFIPGGETQEDAVAGQSVAPVKAHINLEEAQFEIDNFRRVEPTCPFFNTIYLEEFEKFSVKETAALQAANEEYSKTAAIKD